MANYGGFYKGERKKPKKGQGALKNVSSVSPTFTMPQIIGKNKKSY